MSTALKAWIGSCACDTIMHEGVTHHLREVALVCRGDRCWNQWCSCYFWWPWWLVCPLDPPYKIIWWVLWLHLIHTSQHSHLSHFITSFITHQIHAGIFPLIAWVVTFCFWLLKAVFTPCQCSCQSVKSMSWESAQDSELFFFQLKILSYSLVDVVFNS